MAWGLSATTVISAIPPIPSCLKWGAGGSWTVGLGDSHRQLFGTRRRQLNQSADAWPLAAKNRILEWLIEADDDECLSVAVGQKDEEDGNESKQQQQKQASGDREEEKEVVRLIVVVCGVRCGT